MNLTQRRVISALFVSAIIGWVALTAADATYVFLFPHGPGFAPEIGPLGAFIVFGLLFSACYVIEFLLIAVPFHFFLRSRRSVSRFWPRCLLGGALFAIGAAVAALCNGSDSGDSLYVAVLAFIAGFTAFAFLAPQSNIMQPNDA